MNHIVGVTFYLEENYKGEKVELYTRNNFIFKFDDGKYKYLHSPLEVEGEGNFQPLLSTTENKTLLPLLSIEEFILSRSIKIKELLLTKGKTTREEKIETTLEKLMKAGTDDYLKILKDDGLL